MGCRSRPAQGNRPGVTRPRKPGLPTRIAQAGRDHVYTHVADKGGGAVNPPVWRTSTHLFDSVADLRAAGRDRHHRFYYGRRGSPTQWALAEALTALEPGAGGTFLFPSGVAAIAASLLAILSPGDELLMVDTAYDPTRSLCDGLLQRMGITTRYYDPMAGAGIAALIGPATRAIFMESPGSLTFEVQDIPAIVAVARDHGLVTLLDNSWATPLFLPAIALGIDLSIVAATKYLGGHSDVMLGAVTAGPALWNRLSRTGFALGQCVGPDDAWLTLRGLRTLDIRLRQHQSAGLEIARWLATRPEIARVLHPALPSCPGHDHWARDYAGATGLFSIVMKGGDDAAAAALVDGLAHFGIGYSWGGFESLALPVDPASVRSAVPWQGEGPVIRLHVGLEDPADLIADLDAGLARYATG